MTTFYDDFKGIFNSVGINDIVDILIIAYLVYSAICLLRETRAIQLLKGLLVVAVLYAVAALGGLRSVSFIIRSLFQYGAIALLIMFQPELRRTLEQVGRSKLPGLKLFYSSDSEDEKNIWNSAINSIVEATSYLSKRRIGALIVMEKRTKLGEVANTGTLINSQVSAELIGNIFFPNSPLHDGAMLVRDGKIYAAGCLLPLSDNQTISREMGTRHRAGLGLSEQSDALIIIVSEETGVITIASEGKLRRGFTDDQLKLELSKNFTVDKREDKGERKKPFFGVKK